MNAGYVLLHFGKASVFNFVQDFWNLMLLRCS